MSSMCYETNGDSVASAASLIPAPTILWMLRLELGLVLG